MKCGCEIIWIERGERISVVAPRCAGTVWFSQSPVHPLNSIHTFILSCQSRISLHSLRLCAKHILKPSNTTLYLRPGSFHGLRSSLNHLQVQNHCHQARCTPKDPTPPSSQPCYLMFAVGLHQRVETWSTPLDYLRRGCATCAGSWLASVIPTSAPPEGSLITVFTP